MRLYALSGIRSESTGYHATWVYREFYHGDSGPVVNRYGKTPYRPLPLIRNIRFLPDVFFAGISMVVSEQVAEQLRPLEGIHLNPCVWENVYDLPVDEAHVWEIYNKFSVFTEDYGEWLKNQFTSLPEELEKVRYFEVLAPSFPEVQPRNTLLSAAPIVEFTLPSPPYERLPPFRTAAAIHKQNPVLKRTPYYLFVEPAFRIMAPHVKDPALFTIREIELGDQE